MPADALVTVAHGPIDVELLPDIGARLHRLRVFGHDLLRTPSRQAEHRREPFSWGAYVMAPWCNRHARAATVVGELVVRLPPNFPDGTAIHGQVYATPWTREADGTFSVRGGRDEWPWAYRASLMLEIEEATLRILLSLTNEADTPMPAGLGLHPWFCRPLELRVDADRVLASNTDPDASLQPVSGRLDLREMQPMPDDVDAAWLARGGASAELRWPAMGIAAQLSVRSEVGSWIVAASPSTLDAVAVEPQTHAPHGLHRLQRGEPGGLHLLAPGAALRLAIELAFSESVSPSSRPGAGRTSA